MLLIHDQIAFHNVAELEPLPQGGSRLHRFPAEIRQGLGFKHHSRGRFFAHRVAGCELRFVTAGPFVSVTLCAQETDAVVLIYKGDHCHARHHLPAGVTRSLFLEEPAWFSQVDSAALRSGRFSPAVWRLLFNQDAIIDYQGIEAYGHALRPPAADETPRRTWLAYGSSITFGANALHPSNSYVQHAARRLGVDVLCKGLPGSCLCEPELAAWFGAQDDWDFATLELGVNLTDLATPDEFSSRARAFIGVLHRARPEKPLYVTGIYPNRATHLLDQQAEVVHRTRAFNALVREAVHTLAHPSVRYVAPETITDTLADLHTDLIHPSDEGHLVMGEAWARALAGETVC